MELAFWTLDQVREYLSKYFRQKLSDLELSTDDHELFIGWIVGKYLESRNKNKYLIGKPFHEQDNRITLASLPKCKLKIENIEIDIAFIKKGEVQKLKRVDNSQLLRIQIKRYRNKENPNTDHFLKFVNKKQSHYAPDNGLHVVFHIVTGFKLDKSKIRAFTEATTFNVASIWIFCPYLDEKLDPLLMRIHPNFSGIPWKYSRPERFL